MQPLINGESCVECVKAFQDEVEGGVAACEGVAHLGHLTQLLSMACKLTLPFRHRRHQLGHCAVNLECDGQE